MEAPTLGSGPINSQSPQRLLLRVADVGRIPGNDGSADKAPVRESCANGGFEQKYISFKRRKTQNYQMSKDVTFRPAERNSRMRVVNMRRKLHL